MFLFDREGALGHAPRIGGTLRGRPGFDVLGVVRANGPKAVEGELSEQIGLSLRGD